MQNRKQRKETPPEQPKNGALDNEEEYGELSEEDEILACLEHIEMVCLQHTSLMNSNGHLDY